MKMLLYKQHVTILPCSLTPMEIKEVNLSIYVWHTHTRTHAHTHTHTHTHTHIGLVLASCVLCVPETSSCRARGTTMEALSIKGALQTLRKVPLARSLTHSHTPPPPHPVQWWDTEIEICFQGREEEIQAFCCHFSLSLSLSLSLSPCWPVLLCFSVHFLLFWISSKDIAELLLPTSLWRNTLTVLLGARVITK